jgi:hypothetical protein
MLRYEAPDSDIIETIVISRRDRTVFNKLPNVQVSDATDDDSSNAVKYKNYFGKYSFISLAYSLATLAAASAKSSPLDA